MGGEIMLGFAVAVPSAAAASADGRFMRDRTTSPMV